MQIYVEYVILDNLIMDYLLLKETSRLLKEKYKAGRLFFSAVIGTIGALIFPMLNVKPQFKFILKILLGVLICLTAKSYLKVRDFIKYFNVFLLLTFLFGGAVIGVFYLLGISISDYGTSNLTVLPVGVSIICGYVFSLIIKKIVKKTADSFITDKYRYKCIIKVGSVYLKTDGYYDSGNLLSDYKTGLPVVICKRCVIDKLNEKGANLSFSKCIDYHTVSGDGKIQIYQIDCLLIEDLNETKRINCMLGVCPSFRLKEDLLLGAYTL